MPASPASTLAASARPSPRAVRIRARAGSASSRATTAMSASPSMARTVARGRFGPGRSVAGYERRVGISKELGEHRTVEVGAGVVEYRERGSGPVLVFVHGAAVNGDLWRKGGPELARERRCITLDVPLGGHSIALRPGADLSLFGVAGVVADAIDE